jgi:hypothetical protein
MRIRATFSTSGGQDPPPQVPRVTARLRGAMMPAWILALSPFWSRENQNNITVWRLIASPQEREGLRFRRHSLSVRRGTLTGDQRIMSLLRAMPLTCGDRRLACSGAGFECRSGRVVMDRLRNECGLFVACHTEPGPRRRRSVNPSLR